MNFIVYKSTYIYLLKMEQKKNEKKILVNKPKIIGNKYICLNNEKIIISNII